MTEYGSKGVGTCHLSDIFLLFVEEKGEVERKRQVRKTEGAWRGLLKPFLGGLASMSSQQW